MSHARAKSAGGEASPGMNELASNCTKVYRRRMKRKIALFVACLAAAVVGCGTIADRRAGASGGSPYYRGVRLDAQAMFERKPISPLPALDLPLSAAADTALIPYIAYEEHARGKKVKPADRFDRVPRSE